MSARQALFAGAARLISGFAHSGWRQALTPVLFSHKPIPPHADAPSPVLMATDATTGARWLRHDAQVAIEPASGIAFHAPRQALPPWNSSTPVDMTGYFNGKFVERLEAGLVLHGGADASRETYVRVLLPRFAALDRLGVPVETLLFVSLPMMRNPFFQDALRDGVFRPRAVELLRPGTITRVSRLEILSLEAFLGETDTGSLEENATKQNDLKG